MSDEAFKAALKAAGWAEEGFGGVVALQGEYATPFGILRGDPVPVVVHDRSILRNLCDAYAERVGQERAEKAEVERLQAGVVPGYQRTRDLETALLDAQAYAAAMSRDAQRLQEAIKQHRLSCPTTVPVGRDADLYVVLEKDK